MATYRVAVIGTGKKKPRPDLNGYFMAYQHAPAYKKLTDCELVACADIVREHAEAFAAEFGVPRVYTDYGQMLVQEKPDIVSICTWPHLHCQMTLDCIAAGVPAIHCEKPMALTFGECRAMLAAAEAKGTKLTFNHQRRFGLPFRQARALVGAGAIGQLQRMESVAGDLYDGGCHWVDLLNYLNGESPAEWVLGQIDGREKRYAFGAPSEWQGVCHLRYRNGVTAVILTGVSCRDFGAPFTLFGSEGIIEIAWEPKPGPMLRHLRWGGEWTAVDCGGENLHGPGYIDRAIADVVDSLKTGRTSELCAQNEMKAMEIVFGCYESCRRRGRVDLPMGITDSPIVAMIESGALR
jgi:predicted dehydrogenase